MFHTPTVTVLESPMHALISGCDIALYFRATDIPEKEWKLLNHTGNVFTDIEYLRALEVTAPHEMKFCYAVLKHNGDLLGGFVFQTIHLAPDILAEILAPLTKAKSIVSGLSEWLTRCKEETGLRVLISGNSFVSGRHGVLLAKNVDPKIVFAALPEVVKLIVKHDILPHKISIILVKDYSSDSTLKPEDSLKRSRYHSFAVEPEMVVDIRDNWKVFSDYVNSMSKKYRNRTKSAMTKSGALQEHDLDEDGIQDNLDDLFALYKNVHNKARFRLAALTPDYFVAMKRKFPADFKLVMYTLHGKAVGFRSYFRNSNQLEAHFIGLDYSVNRELHLYQRVLYDFVNDAIESVCRTLLLGRTAAEIKSTIGAIPEPLTCYIRHRNGLSNQLIRPFIDYLEPSTWTPREPFK